MRVDKYLKIARLIKRRTVAHDACEESRIFVNGKEAKPGKDIKAGDEIRIGDTTEATQHTLKQAHCKDKGR